MSAAIETPFEPTRSAALWRLNAFLPRAGSEYAQRRNYDLGPGLHEGVSCLSPYLRRRMITETEVLQTVTGRFSPRSAEKFIEEVFWRTYWKGWLEMRPAVWGRYQAGLSKDWDDVQTQGGLRSDWEAACKGETGIDCFDFWARELVEGGYLHNHARMWFASIWIFTLRLPWRLGADFFMRHLLDGDAASNTLSWRWVAGLQTQGKTYLARPDNIRRYTEGRFDPSGLATFATPLPFEPHPAATGFGPPRRPMNVPTGLILHQDDLSPGWIVPQIHNLRAVAYVAGIRPGPLNSAPKIAGFDEAARADMHSRQLPPLDECPVIDAKTAADWAAEHGVEQMVCSYAPVGPVRTAIEAAAHAAEVPLEQLKRPYDERAWPHATHGFFRFKDKIPELLAAL